MFNSNTPKLTGRRRAALMGCTAVLTLGLAQSAGAQDFADVGFSISDGDTVIAGAPPPAYGPRVTRADEQLRRANVDVQFDTLNAVRRLNVSTADVRTAYAPGETVTFRTSTNYPVFVQRAEIHIQDRSRLGRPTILRLPVNANGTVDWAMPASGPDALSYSLRVYDAQGRYDETVPLPLIRAQSNLPAQEIGPFVAPGEGEDRTARRGIPVTGGTVTVSGTGATPGGTVMVMGDAVPVDGSGRFVTSRILPAGDQIVTVGVNGQNIRRDVQIPQSDWFGVGIIDITAGITRGGIDDEEDTYVNGRLAYYVDGRTQNGWRIVSSADTQDGPIEDAFSRLNDKSPTAVIDRLRSDGDVYPTYGDDSQLVDNTPSSGNVYVRLENETTRLLFGDFEGGIDGPELLNNTRSLYGLELAYRTAGVTANGDARFAGSVYAAQPETLSKRDILLGTGGTVYFLSRQDLSSGTSSLTVQVVDPDTGFILESRELQEGTDYRIDHIQGVVILNAPLSSGAGDGTLISGAGSDYDVRLVAQYEYTPTEMDISDSAFGGRAEGWVTDNMRVGITGMQETTDGVDRTMVGADLRYTIGEQSFVDLEVARTDGEGLERSVSTDGGLTITSSAGAAADQAGAVRFTAALDFGDLGMQRAGQLGLRYEAKEAGFVTLSDDIEQDQELFGIDLETQLSDAASLAVSGERFTKDGGDERTEAEVTLSYQLSERLGVDVGIATLDQFTVADADETGSRVDAAVKLSYALSDDASIYGFVQGTVDRSGGLDRNNRAGVGGAAQITDRVGVSGEVSDGDGGLAASARLSYRPSANNEVYIGYSLDPTRNGADNLLNDDGRVVIGGTFRHDERFSTYAETVLDMPGDETSLTQAYGVTYTPSDIWVISGGVETGRIRDSEDGDFDRLALSFGATYRPSEEISVRQRLEYRTEDGDGTTRDRETYAMSFGYSNQVNQDWRLLASADAVISQSAEDDFRDGEYVRASLGYAYRPIDNERLNMLMRVTHVRDLPGEDQVDAAGNDDGPQHRSTAFSLAGSYDLNESVTLGGKVGYRFSEIADRGTDDFSSNEATLLALRLDVNFADQWDALGEVRGLYSAGTGTTETGALVGIYREVGEHARIGVGYEWGNVSDDETAINYDSQGLFLNVIGKF